MGIEGGQLEALQREEKMTDEKYEDEYTAEIREVLQMLWGEGMLSPGGEAHLDEIVKGLDLQDKLVLDIGCALGGFDLLLARKYGARVIGLDVEPALIEDGNRRVAEAGLADRIDLQLYAMLESADFLIPRIGQAWYNHYVEDWRSLTVVVDNGDLRPGRLRAWKPGD